MNTKLTRDAAAFARRVSMSGSRQAVYFFVEGRITDRPFYDRILLNIPQVNELGYSIRLSEQLELNGRSAGGKPFAVQLHEYFRETGKLTQSNSSGKKHIIFLLDRDYESISGKGIDSNHIVYTKSADAESEILLNGDIQRATGSSYGLDSRLLSRVFAGVEDPARWLALRWRRWITLMVTAISGSIAADIQHAGSSAINKDKFGHILPHEDSMIEAKLLRLLRDQGSEHVLISCRNAVEEIYRSGKPEYLVKGKWLEEFIQHLVHSRIPEVPVGRTNRGELTKACIDTVNYSGSLVDHYKDLILRVI